MRLQNADIGLVRNHAFDVVNGQVAATQRLFRGRLHGDDGALEHLFAGHLQMMHSRAHRLFRSRIARPTRWHQQNVRLRTVRAHARRQDPVSMFLAAAAQNRRARAVAEQDARAAILPVDDRRQFFRADDQHRVVRPGRDEL